MRPQLHRGGVLGHRNRVAAASARLRSLACPDEGSGPSVRAAGGGDRLPGAGGLRRRPGRRNAAAAPGDGRRASRPGATVGARRQGTPGGAPGGRRPPGSQQLPGAGVGPPRRGGAPGEGRRSGRRRGRAVGRRSQGRAPADAGRRTVRQAARSHARLTPVPGGESIGGNGTIPIPTNVPEAVQKVVAGANEIADFPYVFGGGHASFVDNAYDCSGSVSYALAAGGLLGRPETSGELESWGAPGPGPLHHGVRKRRAHLHVRGRHPVRHGRAQRRVRLALAGHRCEQQRLRRAPLARALRGRVAHRRRS